MAVLVLAAGLAAKQVYTVWQLGGAARIETNPESALLALGAAGAAVGVAASLWSPVSAHGVSSARIGALSWFRRAAVVLSFAAFALATDAVKLWEYGAGEGMHPSPLTHDGFHQVLVLGSELSWILGLLILAWGPLNRGSGWGFVGLLATLPCVTLYVWAGATGLTFNRDWAHQHVLLEAYVLAVPVLVSLAVISAACGHVTLRAVGSKHVTSC